MKSIILLGFLAGLMALSSCSNARDEAAARPQGTGELSGVASVVDGDTIEIHGQRIRLSGYDTPESGKRCGRVNVYREAALALSDFIGRQTVSCDTEGEDRYERIIATCSVGGTDLGDFIVGEGWGRDWPQYSDGKYADEERAARQDAKGIWGLDCPEDLWGNRTYD